MFAIVEPNVWHRCKMAQHVPIGISTFAIGDDAMTFNSTWPVRNPPNFGRLFYTRGFAVAYGGYGDTPKGAYEEKIWLQVTTK